MTDTHTGRPVPDIDTTPARRLVDRQFPQWAEVQLTPLASSDTVHAVFRLGDGMTVRLPLRTGAVEDVVTGHH